MLMSPTVYFREEQDPHRALRTGLLSSAAFEAIRRVRSGVVDTSAKTALLRGARFLRVAAAFCRGSFVLTEDGITSTEAFSAVVGAAPPSTNMVTLAELLERYADILERAIEDPATNTYEVQELFSKLRESFMEDRGVTTSGVEKWRL